jgi:REP element-mobilizing transposase RayT
MATTLVDNLLHIVFSTKRRRRLITPDAEPLLYRYIGGIVRSLDSRCLAINGVEDHLHLLISLSKTVALSEFMRQVKGSSAKWLKQQDERVFRDFGWQDGYGSFSVSRSRVPLVLEYIARQKEHHRSVSFEDEYRALVVKAQIAFDERFLFD